MTRRLLAPGDLVLDYSYARPSLKIAAASGVKAFIRYSAGAASDPSHSSHNANAGKLITPAEYKAIVAAGFDVIANDEWYEDRVTEGYKAGLADGRAAAALWRSCGHPRGATVYCSWDAAPSRLKYRAVRRYLKGWREGAQGYYEVDLYGGTPVLRALMRKGVGRIRYGWRPNAGSWSNDGLPYQPRTGTAAARAALVAQALNATPAHVWQTGNYWFGQSADENLVVRTPLGSRNDTLAEREPKPDPADNPTPPVVVDEPDEPVDGVHRLVSRDGHYVLTFREDGAAVIRRDGHGDRVVETREVNR